MSIRILKHLDSEVLDLPELRPLLGRDVEIVVHEAGESIMPSPMTREERTKLWESLGPIEIDEDALGALRKASMI